MASFSQSRREERLNATYSSDVIVDSRTYNMVLGCTVLEGIIVNVILCTLVGNVYEYINPLAFLIGYFVFAFAGMFISAKSDSPVISFIGYNMVVVPVGLVISTAVYAYGGIDSPIVTQAFLFTLVIVAVMVGMSIAYPGFFASLGRVLGIALIALILVEVVCLIMGVNTIIFAWIGAGIFSIYIGYDFWRAQQFEKTVDNAVDSAVDIYLDIANLFIRILEILGSAQGGKSRR